ncbi:hypothetical protein [Photobacterium damselae]|uniref:hypothetical protein n=1 Tax=Photobacterium damselae TaxID=38293 RepID=UPI0040681F0B
MSNILETFYTFAKSSDAVVINEKIHEFRITNSSDTAALFNIKNIGIYPISNNTLMFNTDNSKWTITGEDKVSISIVFVEFNKLISPDLTTYLSGSMPLTLDTFCKLEEYIKEKNLIPATSLENIESGELKIDVDFLKSALDNDDELIDGIIDQIVGIIGDELVNKTIFKSQFAEYANLTFYC